MTATASLDHVPPAGFEGRTLGGYRLSREIARGGMATVYLGCKRGVDGKAPLAAIKVIHPHLSDEPEAMEMFLDEARVLSCVNHRNVCRVLDFGQAERTHFLVLEYLEGETWAAVIERMKARPEARSRIPAMLTYVLAQCCAGLHAAHEACGPQGSPLRIVHRDVAPHNILVGYDGRVSVLDFGIASAAEKLHNTAHGTIKGRLSYMAPEQMRGHPVDRRADIWSLGVMLWEGLAQRRLFRRRTDAETALAVSRAPVPAIQKLDVQVPAVLERIAGRALSRDLESRYATAQALAGALATCGPMAPDEVADWMHRLFADRIEKTRTLTREAAKRERRVDTSSITLLRRSAGDSARVLSGADVADTQHTNEAPLARTHARPKRWLTLIAVLIALAAASYYRLAATRRVSHQDLQAIASVASTKFEEAEAALAALRAHMQELSAEPPINEAMFGELTQSAPDEMSEPTSLAATEAPSRGMAEPLQSLPGPAPRQNLESVRNGSTDTIEAPKLETTYAAEEPEVTPAPKPEATYAPEPEAMQVPQPGIIRAKPDGTEAAKPATVQVPQLATVSSRDKAGSTPEVSPEANKAGLQSRPRLAQPLNMGTLDISATGGWAEVREDGKTIGITPAHLDLPAGSHDLEIFPFGRGTGSTRHVEVVANQVTKLRVTLGGAETLSSYEAQPRNP